MASVSTLSFSKHSSNSLYGILFSLTLNPMSPNTVNARNGSSNGPRNQMEWEERLAAIESSQVWVLLYSTRLAAYSCVWRIIYLALHILPPNCLSPVHWESLPSKYWM